MKSNQNSWKCGDGWAGSWWRAVVVGWKFLVVLRWKSVGDALTVTGKAKSGVNATRAGTGRPGSPHGRRMGYLPWLILWRLLRQNPRARGEHITSQLSWATAWLLVKRVYSFHVVDELNVFKPLMTGLMVVLLMLFLDGEYGFTSMWSWCYSRECVWNLRIRLCCIASAKWNVSRVALQGFDIGYVIFKVAQFEPIWVA